MTSRLQLVVLSYILTVIAGACLGSWLMYRHLNPPVTVQIGQDGTPTILVPKADLSGRDVAPLGVETAAVVNALRQNHTTVQAVAKTTGTVRLAFNKGEQPAVAEQKVEGVAVASTDKSGQPRLKLDLYQIGDNGTRTAISESRIAIVSQPQLPRWRVGLAFQAGAGLTVNAAGQRAAVAVLALPWLRRGGGHAEDTGWSLLAPAVLMAGTSAEVGVVPFTYNIAKYIPLLADVHVGPVVSWNVKTQQPRVGLAISATF